MRKVRDKFTSNIVCLVSHNSMISCKCIGLYSRKVLILQVRIQMLHALGQAKGIVSKR